VNVTDVSIGSINCDPNNADRGRSIIRVTLIVCDIFRNSSFRYIDDVLSLNNSRFGYYLHRIHPNEFEVKDTTDTQNGSS
jgi:hypothetical protein